MNVTFKKLRNTHTTFSNKRPPSVAPSDVDFMEGYGAPDPNDFGFDKGTLEEENSILGALKRSNSERASAFTSFVESNKAREQQVHFLIVGNIVRPNPRYTEPNQS